jgi:F-type H+-transporting ATPase subunit b
VNIAIAVLAAEGAAEAETKNPILPVENELFWGAVTFLLLWALMKFVFLPPLLKVMAERDAKVRGDVEAGEHARAQAELAVAEYDQSLLSARAEASRIIEDARVQAEAQRRELIAAAEAEVAQRKAEAAAEVAAAKAAAMDELRDSVAGIAVGAAEAVVQKRLDEAAQLRIIEDYVNRAGSTN